MRDVKMTRLIGKGVDRTVLILFKSFSVRKWLTLLLIAYLAGALPSGSGGGGGGGETAGTQREATAAQITPAAGVISAEEDPATRGFMSGLGSLGIGWFLLAIGALILAVAVWLLFTWLGARFRFIWLNAVVRNVSAIIDPFKRYRSEGNSLFKFFIIYDLGLFVYFALLIGWVVYAAVSAGVFQGGFEWSLPLFLGLFGGPLAILLISLLCVIIFFIAVEDFVVVIMATDACRFTHAWKKFVGIYRGHRRDFLVYYLVKLGLGVLGGAAQFVLAFAGVILVLLLAALLFGLPYLLIVSLLKARLLFVILAVVIGIPFVIAALLLFLSIGLPFAVFFRSFSLYFISSLKSGYTPLSLEEKPAG